MHDPKSALLDNFTEGGRVQLLDCMHVHTIQVLHPHNGVQYDKKHFDCAFWDSETFWTGPGVSPSSIRES